MPYNVGVDEQSLHRFRRAFWGAFRDADSLRLRQWERSRLTLPQLRVLYHVRRHPEITTGALARALRITVSTTSGLVIKLVEQGLIERGSAADDRRQAPLSLSPAGAALLGELAGDARSFLQDVAEKLGDDFERVMLALERLGDAASEARLSIDPCDEATTRTAAAGRRA
ncbi:MAG: winged helix-turn-helix transcriptional regulator [Chloroflexi bacterium]|nr:winged helix-turn-helix transcriptional regulator [Chloroflexota bacterium]